MPVMSRPTMRACMVSMPSKVWMASARLHRFADIRNTRNRRANSRSLAPASIRSAAASRIRSRRARSAPVSPPPSGVSHGSGIARCAGRHQS